jgi:hypothetical protein
MSEMEYGEWVENDGSLQRIIESHKKYNRK